MKTLKSIATILPGHPFRGAIKDEPEGTSRVLLMRSVDESGQIDWSGTVRTTPQGRREPNWLKPGDIAFLARGSRNIAALVEAPPENALIAPHFFLLRIKQSAPMLPGFLAWQINQAPAQTYFATWAEGSGQRSIRRAVLEALPLVTPSLDVQKRLMHLAEAARAEASLYKELIANRERMLMAVAADILTTNSHRS